MSTSTPSAPPDLVEALNLSHVSNASVSAVWRRPSSNGAPIEAYHLFACDAAPPYACFATSVANATVGTLEGLPAGRNLTLLVGAENSVGQSGNRTLACAAAPCVTTHAPPLRGNAPFKDEPLPGLPVTTTLLVTWAPPFANGLPIDTYELVVDGATVAVDATEGEPQYLHYDLIPGTVHTFSVSARNALGLGEMSDVLTAATADDVPATPPAPKAVSQGDSVAINITRSAYSGTLGLPLANLTYRLEELRENSDLPAAYVDLPGFDAYHVEYRSREVSQDYRYRVRAISAHGRSEWSAAVRVLNDYSNVPTIPTNVSTVAAPDGGVEVTWQVAQSSKNEGAEYTIKLECETAVAGWTDNCTDVEARVDGAAVCTPEPVDGFYTCSASVAGVTAFATYDVEVAGVNSAGSSLFSSPSTVNTTRTSPGAPAAFRIGQVSETSLELQWRTPPNNGHTLRGYLVSYASDEGAEGAFSLDYTGNNRLEAATACDNITAPTAELPEGQPLASLLAQLSKGTSYRINMTACNALGEGAPSCVCAGSRCGAVGEDGELLSGCTAEPTPAHTHDVPERPQEPVDVADASLDERKKHEIFMTWTPPYDNESPLTLTEVSVTESLETNGSSTEVTQTFEVSPTQRSFNLSGLSPATQYRCSLRMRNAYGWSPMSLDAWLWTRPARPEAAPPTCEQRVTVDALEDTMILIDVQPADENGQAVLEYEVNVSYGPRLLWRQSVGASVEERAVVVGTAEVELFTSLRYGVNGSLVPQQDYAVRVRARNGIDWSEPSEPVNCTATAVREQEFPWIAVLVPAILAVLCLIGLVAWCYAKNKSRILAPKLRKKESHGDVLKDFIDDGATPMEDMDPELVMNPVLMARMQMEKEAKNRGRKKGKGGLSNKTGGLARLGLKVDGVEENKREAKPLQVQVDEFLQDAVGIEARSGAAGGSSPSGGGRAAEVERNKKLTIATERIGRAGEKQEKTAAARGAAREAAYREKL